MSMIRITTIAMPIETSHFNAFAKNPTTTNRMKNPTSTRRRVKRFIFSYTMKNYNFFHKYLTLPPINIKNGENTCGISRAIRLVNS